jgi:ribulose-phosphate 3-epimerase
MVMRITPSILNADFGHLAREIAKVPGADAIHVDVMDNHFVPNLTIGLPVVEAIRQVTTKPLDIHLMIEDPDRWAPAYAEARAESVTFHSEAARAPVRLARQLHAQGARVGVALKPATSLADITGMLSEVDTVLLMTVEPGFGGQGFLDLVLPKISALRSLIAASNLDIRVQVDGGVSLETVERCAEAGADTFVAGTAVFRAQNPDAMVRELRARATLALQRLQRAAMMRGPR